MKKGKYSSEEILFLKENYPNNGKSWCMKQMNRSEGSIRDMASKLGLTLNKESDFFKEFQSRAAKSKVGKKRPEHSELMIRYAKEGRLPTFGKGITQEEKTRRSIQQKRLINEKGHPKGFKGHRHSKESKAIMSQKSIEAWSDPTNYVNSNEYRQLLSDRQSKQMTKRLKENPTNVYSRTKKGKVKIGDKEFYARSSWEANIAAYFEFLKSNNEISNWEHEPETFWFEKIKRGVRSYLPDFRITENDGTIYYVEVKGWMDSKSKTKLKRFAKYYPNLKMEVIDQKRYKEISKSKSLFKYWGLLD